MSNIQKSDRLFPSIFSDFFEDRFFNQPIMRMPAVNIAENDKSYDIELATPGISKENIKIKIEDDVLSISAEQKTENSVEKANEYKRREFSFQSFQKSFTLPKNIDTDAINAKCENGVLYISLPKTDNQQRTKEIKF